MRTASTGVRTETELSVVVPNEPGQLARLTGALRAAGVNVAGVMMVHAGATARVSFLVDGSAHQARAGLESAGCRVAETRVFALDGPPDSELAPRVVCELAAAGINILSCYSQEQPGGVRFVVAVDRPDEAEALIAKCL